MARADSKEIELLRHEYYFYKKFDVALITNFESNDGGTDRFPFFDSIGAAIEKLEKKVFLPHRELSIDWQPNKIYNVANGIVIPTVDIALCYYGIESIAVGIMAARAQLSKVPLTYFWEESLDKRAPVLSFGSRPVGSVNIFRFRTDKECIDLIVEKLNKFYEI